MHAIKTAKRPIVVERSVWESLPLPPRVRRAYERTGNVIPVDMTTTPNTGTGS